MRRSVPHRAPRVRPVVLLLATVGVLAASLGAAVIPTASTPEAGAQSKTVTITPAAARAGEFVTVRWSGYTPGAPVSIFQCRFSTPLTWETGCPEATWTGGVTGPDGSGSAQFQVWQFTLQALGGNNAMFCGQSGCDIVVTECDTQLLPGQFARTPIQVDFGGTNPIPEPDDDLELASAGSTVHTDPIRAASSPPVPGAAATVAAAPVVTAAAATSITVRSGQAMDPLLEDLAERVEGRGVDLNSTVINSPSAVEAFVNGSTDLALTSRPLSAEQRAELTSAGRPATLIPIAVSPQAIIHNMDVRGVPIQRFRLSVDSMAKLYRSLIVGVDSDELRADNGGCGITQSGRTTDRSILGFFRTDRSAANYLFSSWLATAGQLDGRPIWPPLNATAPDEQFPTADSARGRSDNEALTEFIRVGSPPGEAQPLTNEAGRLRIAYVDASAYVEALRHEQPTVPGRPPLSLVEIRNAAGNWVTPTPARVNATLATSAINPDNSVSVNVTAAAADAYPLVNVVYALVPNAPSGGYTADKAVAGKAFVQYLLSAEGQQVLSDGGMVPLTPAIAARATAAAAALQTGPLPALDPRPAPSPAPAPGPDAGFEEFGGGFDDGFGDSFGESFGDDFAGDELLGTEDGFVDDADVLADGELAESSDEVTGDSVINSSSSLLDRIAGAPALVLVLVLGAAAFGVGQVLRRVDRRRSAAAAAASTVPVVGTAVEPTALAPEVTS